MSPASPALRAPSSSGRPIHSLATVSHSPSGALAIRPSSLKRWPTRSGPWVLTTEVISSAARQAVAPENTRPRVDSLQDTVDVLQLGQQAHALPDPLVGELDDGVAVDGHLARARGR